MKQQPIVGEDIIEQQLAAQTSVEVKFRDGHSTVLVPSRRVPVLDDKASRLTLNGAWRVVRYPFALPEQDLAACGCDDSTWETRLQPGKVFYCDGEQNPHSVKGRDQVGLTHIDPDDGAVIRREVVVPAGWVGSRIYLNFDAIYPAGRVYCNGKLLGEHTSGLTPVQYDVTALVHPGERVVVAVRLLRRHAFVKMDMPRHAMEFTGLCQSAYLSAAEPLHVCDYHLVTELDASLARGWVAGDVTLANEGNQERACSVTVALVDMATGVDVGSGFCAVSVPAGAKAEAHVAIEVARPRLWNDEYPNLYRVEIRLEVAGQSSQLLAYRTGFRRFELKDARPLLNGHPVKFRGVNHLTYHFEHGMYTPLEWLRECLALMKKANVNCIRTHFLGPRCLADLCDEMGVYLMQELPIDWGTNYIHDPAWVGPALQRIEGGVRRDRHHPSVMVWSVGNENMPESAKVAEDGWNHLRIYDKFVKQLDSSRPTMFPPPGPANKVIGIFETRVGDIADTHYSFKLYRQLRETGQVSNPRTWEGDMETTTLDEARARGWSGVWFSSEYGIFNLQPDLLHAPYLSVIGDTPPDMLSGQNSLEMFYNRLREEWGLMRSESSCLGGAYFPWICAGAGNNPWGWVRWGEGADWGVVTADLMPKPAFWALRVLFSPVCFPDRIAWHAGQESLSFTLENQLNAIDLKDCTLRVMMGGGGAWMGFLTNWRDIPVACPPGEHVTVTIPLYEEGSRNSLKAGAAIVCRCALLLPSGFRLLNADILVIPETVKEVSAAIPIGPDAEG